MMKLLTPEIIKKRATENRIKKAAKNIKIKKEKIEKMILSCKDKFVSKICELFINRWDCYAIQDHENPLIFPTVYRELTIDIIQDSLKPESNITIGIHQINEDKVKWLCYDIDKKHTPNPKLLVKQIIKYLKEWYSLTGYIEPSGSHDSYHVWIFTEPTSVDIAINFHKAFKNRLKSVNVDTSSIEKGVSRGDKGLGCMIKLPFNIQRKSNKRSELLADIFNIIPEKIPVIDYPTIVYPVIQEPKQFNQIQKTQIQNFNQTDKSIITEQFNCTENAGNGCVVVCYNTAEHHNYDAFENTSMCQNIIFKIPGIMKWINQIEPDRSKLDFMIIKALAEVGISEKTIYKYLQTLPSSKTKIHERGYSYFDLTYSNVIKKLNDYEND